MLHTKSLDLSHDILHPLHFRIVMSQLNRINISDKINSWFYTRLSDNIAPADTVCMIANDFDACVEKFGLSLPLFTKFRDTVCSATCSMYHASLNNKTVVGNFKSIVKPDGWNNDIEAIWIDYILTMFLDSEFWSNFWHDIEPAIWESEFTSYRTFIQSILPMYINRKYDILYEAGLLFQNKEGDFVTADEYDERDEYNEYDT